MSSVRAVCPYCANENECAQADARGDAISSYVICPVCARQFRSAPLVREELGDAHALKRHKSADYATTHAVGPGAHKQARERLQRRIASYTDYHDRDSDILLLHILDLLEALPWSNKNKYMMCSSCLRMHAVDSVCPHCP